MAGDCRHGLGEDGDESEQSRPGKTGIRTLAPEHSTLVLVGAEREPTLRTLARDFSPCQKGPLNLRWFTRAHPPRHATSSLPLSMAVAGGHAHHAERCGG